MDASIFAKTDSNTDCHASAQLFGEYLHTFEDTFAHRDKDNAPYTATTFGYGIGHALAGENPDYTYNHVALGLGAGYWGTNEDRTLEAEKEVFAKFAAWGDPGKAKNFAAIEGILKSFNAIDEHEKDGATTEERQLGYPRKINLLQSALTELGYSGINISQSGALSFNTIDASKNRNIYLHAKDGKALDQSKYQGTLLPR